MADWRMVMVAVACLTVPVPLPAPAQDAPAAVGSGAGEGAEPVPESDAEPVVGTGAVDDAVPDAAPVPQQLVWMGTGSIAGVYFPVGVSLCRLVNQHRPQTGIRCAATPTAGSVENIAKLRDGSLQLAIVQSDTQADALAGSGTFSSPMADLRAVMGLYDEPLAIVARPDAGIAAISDLAGKRVSLGEDGSGTRVVAEAVMTAFGIDPAGFAATPSLAPVRLGEALCDRQIDAFLYTVGQPALPIQEATGSCGALLIPVEGPPVAALLADRPAFVASEIPGGLYAGAAAPVPTLGVKAILVTRADVPDEVVGAVVSSALDDIETLRSLDPVLAGLEPADMASGGLVAPLHPAAEALYRARDLVPE